MNFQNYFSEVKVTVAPWYVILFVIVWIAFGIGSAAFTSSRPSSQLKKLWHDRLCIFGGITFFLFIAAIFVSAHNFFPLLIFAPASALITWLNVRNTYFCDKCGKQAVNSDWFGQAAFHCPKCGKKLK